MSFGVLLFITFPKKTFLEASLKRQMMEISEMVSLAYIAKHPFKKTPQWLYARVNGNKLNGKQAVLSDRDINVLNMVGTQRHWR